MTSDLPSGWDWVRLGEIAADVRYGYTASADEQPVGPKFLRITDIVGGSPDWNRVPYCCLGPKDLERYRLTEGDIVIARTGASVGVSAYCDPPSDAIFASYLVRFRVDRAHADPRFVAAVLRSPAWRGFVSANSAGSAQPQLNASIMRTFELPAPPVTEQARIAAVLGTLDDKIDSNRRMAALLEQTAATVFRARFVDFVGNEELKASDIGPIPPGWTVGVVADLASVEKESVHPAEEPDKVFEHFGIPAFDQDREPELTSGATMLSAKTRLPNGDCVLVSKLNPQRWWRIWWPRPSRRIQAVCSPEFVVLTPRDQVPTTYLFALLSHNDQLRRQILSHVSGTTGSRQRVRPHEILASAVFIPDRASMQAWDLLARPLYEHAHGLHAEGQSLASIRHGLLPKLISGEIRVPDTTDPDEAIGAVTEEVAA